MCTWLLISRNIYDKLNVKITAFAKAHGKTYFEDFDKIDYISSTTTSILNKQKIDHFKRLNICFIYFIYCLQAHVMSRPFEYCIQNGTNNINGEIEKSCHKVDTFLGVLECEHYVRL